MFRSTALMFAVAAMAAVCARADTWTDPETGYTWNYTFLDKTDGVEVRGVSPDPVGALDVPERVNGRLVRSIGDYAFRDCTLLGYMTVPNCVTNMGYGVFSGCGSLSSLTLPFVGSRRGNSGVKESLFGWIFGEEDFAGAEETWQPYKTQYIHEDNYARYRIPVYLNSLSITDETVVPYGAFYGCRYLENVTVNDGPVYIEQGAFEGCRSLVDFDIPETVVSIAWNAFRGCESLESVTIPGGAQEILGHAFGDCTRLARVTLPGSAGTVAGTTFDGCPNLTAFIVSPAGSAFREESGMLISSNGTVIAALEGIIEALIPEDVTDIGEYAFSNCGNLKSLTIPDGVTAIGPYAFSNCRNLASVTIPASVTNIEERAFNKCISLKSLTFEGMAPQIGAHVFDNVDPQCCAYFQDGCAPSESWEGVNINNAVNIDPVPVTVEFDANGGNVSPSSMVFKSGDSIVVSSLPVPVRDGYTFDGWFTSAEGGEQVGSSTIVTDDSTFYAHWTLTGCELTIENGVLLKVTLPEFSTEKVVVVPDGVTGIGEAAFQGCNRITGVRLPASLTYIGAAAFYGCWNLETVVVPPGVADIGRMAFAECPALCRAELPSAVRDNVNDNSVFSGSNVAVFYYIGDNPSCSQGALSRNGDGSWTFPSSGGGIGHFVTGPGTVSFRWKTSSAANMDQFSFYVNDENAVPALTGDSGWQTVTYEVASPGEQRLYWQYDGADGFSGDLGDIVWTPKRCKVVFDANGGECDIAETDVLANASIVSLPVPVREGFKFDGWFRSASGGAGVFAYTVVTDDVTFYAHWSVGVYDVTFVSGVGSPTDMRVTYGSAVGELPPDPTRRGYTFDGWFTAAEGGERVYADTVIKGDSIFYAHWTAYTYQVTYDPGEFGEGQLRTVIKVYACDIVLCDALFTRPGYTQIGWTTSDGGPKTHSLGQTYANNSALTLYPCWEINTYTVTLDANGVIAWPVARELAYGSTVGYLPSMIRPGYSFDGWFTAEEGGEMVFSDATVTGDITYYAHWSVKTYEVTYDPGMYGSGSPLTETKLHDAPLTVEGALFARTGHTQTGWSASDGGEMAYAFGAIYGDNASLTLYPCWGTNRYTVTFDANGGEGGWSGELDYGADLIEPAVTRAGYTFNGWLPEVPATVQAGDATYVAQWTVNKHTVTFDANGGEGGWSQVLDYAADIVAPAVTREGYTFKGWQPQLAEKVPDCDVTYVAQWEINRYTVTFDTNGGEGGRSERLEYGTGIDAPEVTRKLHRFAGWMPEVAATVPASNVTYVAQWRAADSVVSLMDGDLELDAVAAFYGEPIGELPVPSKEGFSFIGWFDAAKGGERVDAEAIITEDTVLYAYWLPVDGLLVCLAEAYLADPEGSFTLELKPLIFSESATKVTVKGLPAGLKYDTKAMAISGKATKPGVYTVTVSATNATVKTPVMAQFTLTVPNLTTDLFVSAGLDSAGLYLLQGGVAPDLHATISAVTGDGWKLAVSGLPSGLKYDAKNAAITGVATKEGTYTVYFTATKGRDKQVATATFEVEFPTLSLAVAPWKDPEATGTVSGAGRYPYGKKVTLKATPAKGSVFSGWLNGDGMIVSTAASWSYVMSMDDASFTAQFALATEDKTAIGLEIATPSGMGTGSTWTGLDEGIVPNWDVMCGVATDWPLATSGLSAITLKATGLPAGLKLVQDKETKAYSISGIPTTASKKNAKTGVVTPSKVKLTATSAGKSSKVYNVEVTVLPLYDWAQGTFTGYVWGGMNDSLAGAVQSFTVTAAGKISGKAQRGATAYTLTGNGFESLDGKADLIATVVEKAGKAVTTNTVTVSESEIALEDGTLLGVAEGADWIAYQNLWKGTALKPVAAKMAKAPILTLSGTADGLPTDGDTLTVKVAATGVATVKGTFVTGVNARTGKPVTATASTTAPLIPTGADTYSLFIHLPPKGVFPGYSAELSLTWTGSAFAAK